jgi:hypothetical protein
LGFLQKLRAWLAKFGRERLAMPNGDIVDAIRALWERGRQPTYRGMEPQAPDAAAAAPDQTFEDSLKGAEGFTDPIADGDVINAARQSGVRFYRGYFGKPEQPRTAEQGWRRLYLSLEFSDFIDIRREAIVRVIDLRTPFNQLAGQGVWVRVGYDLFRGTTGFSSGQVGSFLGGSLTAGAGAAYGGGGGPGYSPEPLCHGYSPEPLCHGYSPEPLCHGYSPEPLCHGISPEPLCRR